jgi:hypothetical protein
MTVAAGVQIAETIAKRLRVHCNFDSRAVHPLLIGREFICFLDCTHYMLCST